MKLVGLRASSGPGHTIVRKAAHRRRALLAAAVAVAIPSMAARAADYVFTPTVPPSGNVMDPAQYPSGTVPGTVAPARLDIAGGAIGNFGSGTFANTLTLQTL